MFVMCCYYVRFLIEILEILEQQTPRVMFSKSDEVSEAPRHAYLVHSPALRLLVSHFLHASRFDFRHPPVGSAITLYNHSKSSRLCGLHPVQHTHRTNGPRTLADDVAARQVF